MTGDKWTLLNWILIVVSISVNGMLHRKHMLPTILNEDPSNISVHLGQEAKLPCLIKYLGPKKVAWRKATRLHPLFVGTELFDPSESNDSMRVEHIKVNETLSEWNLIIRRASPKHTGTYECQISANNAPKRHVYLYVSDTPLILEPKIEVTGPQYVNLYEPFTLLCNATGSTKAPDEIDWFFKTELIRTNDVHWADRTVVTKRIDQASSQLSLLSDLILDYSVAGDHGRYICRSLNYKDNSIQTTSIEVNVLNTNKDVSKRGNDDEDQMGYLSSDESGRSGSLLVYKSYSRWTLIITPLVIVTLRRITY